MKQRIVAIAVLLGLLSILPAAAGIGKRCSPSGTWYGGSAGAKYLMTIIPKGGNSFSVSFEGAYSLEGIGVAVSTNYSGEMEKVAPNTYEARIISIASSQADPPPTDENALQLVAGRSWMELTDCNEMTSTIDYFGSYFGWGAEPFIDEADVDLLGGGPPIVETYRRISMAPME